MPQEEFVVKLNESTDLYLTVYSTNPDNCQWGGIEDAIIFETLEAAEEIARSIGGGTLGTPK